MILIIAKQYLCKCIVGLFKDGTDVNMMLYYSNILVHLVVIGGKQYHQQHLQVGVAVNEHDNTILWQTVSL